MKFDAFIKKLRGKKPLLAVLIDPDKYNPELVRQCKGTNVACFLVGGSRLEKGSVSSTIRSIKKLSALPVIIFPGSSAQLDKQADGLLLLSLLSGRNPDYLIGEHIKAAPMIRKMKLPYLSTAYLLVGRHTQSSTRQVTGTIPLDVSEPDELMNTCLAAEQLGFSAIYLEAGSGAENTIPAALLRKISKLVNIPVIAGGGVDSASRARQLITAGASMVVVGNALEKNVYLVAELSKCFPAR